MSADVRESTLTGRARLYIDPQDNVMIGSSIIMKYLGIKSVVTMYTWIEVWGFPIVKLPNGQFMTTMTAIDQWVFMAAEADAKNRVYPRGSNSRADIALAQAQRRVEKMRREKAEYESGHTSNDQSNDE